MTTEAKQIPAFHQTPLVASTPPKPPDEQGKQKGHALQNVSRTAANDFDVRYYFIVKTRTAREYTICATGESRGLAIRVMEEVGREYTSRWWTCVWFWF
ncbi:hypothetical protein L798_05373 [Zootermopsis nevadensis]|uniref:Uncharacterized protein n=1 Tax=Zootermopsis nevadensis TaxID=136037 RepID=A0A067RRU7_ZOONE|nr:hypothetical protein L798_05373 [Zootermopsis nevadensis]